MPPIFARPGDGDPQQGVDEQQNAAVNDTPPPTPNDAAAQAGAYSDAGDSPDPTNVPAAGYVLDADSGAPLRVRVRTGEGDDTTLELGYLTVSGGTVGFEKIERRDDDA
jgi:hypothetical protein